MNRINIQAVQPEAYTALFGLENYLTSCSLPASLKELVRLHTSQINSCTFCIGIHRNAAKKLGETDERLEALADWKTSDLFTNKEQTVLAVTEAITLIAEKGLPDDHYHKLTEFFSDTEIAQLIVLITTINTWNRIGIATAMHMENVNGDAFVST